MAADFFVVRSPCQTPPYEACSVRAPAGARGGSSARMQPRESQTLTQRNIYIVPSRAGLAFCLTLLLLLVVSINYQLSLGFALTFLLAGSAAASMQMTHGSLRGLTLHLKPLVPAFDGDAAVLEMVVTNPGREPPWRRLRARPGHASDRARIRGDRGARPERGAPELARAGPRAARAAAGARGVALPVRLFRAWTIWRPAGQQWVYPRPETPTPPWPQTDRLARRRQARRAHRLRAPSSRACAPTAAATRCARWCGRRPRARAS